MPSRRVPAVLPPDFPRAFRTARVAVGIPQEAFDTVSSRTYVSILERGVNVPTLTKIDALVRVLGLHPLTVLTLAYANSPCAEEIQALQAHVAAEIESLGLSNFSPASLPRGKPRRRE
ncbi:helix-turn-helix transcriptional regulator [Variovorax sp. J22G73]|nr:MULTISPECIES: helix-turn-helix transcriptional regulator [unclassified Variovorax]MDM0008448.1 helix-turn-helix transcriptional regulator [Variovorax sp. J22R203]MDM0100955.1 helix-turn-helix transcriptional regulator [Variovorax sp. J22G73]